MEQRSKMCKKQSVVQRQSQARFSKSSVQYLALRPGKEEEEDVVTQLWRRTSPISFLFFPPSIYCRVFDKAATLWAFASPRQARNSANWPAPHQTSCRRNSFRLTAEWHAWQTASIKISFCRRLANFQTSLSPPPPLSQWHICLCVRVCVCRRWVWSARSETCSSSSTRAAGSCRRRHCWTTACTRTLTNDRPATRRNPDGIRCSCSSVLPSEGRTSRKRKTAADGRLILLCLTETCWTGGELTDEQRPCFSFCIFPFSNFFFFLTYTHINAKCSVFAMSRLAWFISLEVGNQHGPCVREASEEPFGEKNSRILCPLLETFYGIYFSTLDSSGAATWRRQGGSSEGVASAWPGEVSSALSDIAKGLFFQSWNVERAVVHSWPDGDALLPEKHHHQDYFYFFYFFLQNLECF